MGFYIYLIQEETVTEDEKQKSWCAPFAVTTPEEAFEYLQKASYENGEWHYDFDCLYNHEYMIKAVGVGDFTFSGKNGKPVLKKGTCTITIHRIRVRGEKHESLVD